MNKNKFLLYFVIYHALGISFFTPDKEVRIGLQSDVWHATLLLRRVAGNSYLLSSLPTHEFVLFIGLSIKTQSPATASRLTWHLLYTPPVFRWLPGVPRSTEDPEWPPAPFRLTDPTNTCPPPIMGEPNLFTPVYSLHNHAWVTNYLNWFSLRPTLRGFFCPHTTIYEMENRQRTLDIDKNEKMLWDYKI